jgi:hypothetical protein
MTWAVPLVPVAWTGMEHILQIGLALLFVDLVARIVAEPQSAENRALDIGVLVATALLCSVRYEGAFLVLPAAVLIAKQRGLRRAGLLCLSAAAPVMLFGIVSVAHGWPPSRCRSW